MLEERQGGEYGVQQFSATDSLKKLVIEKLSKTIDMACKREESVAQYTTDTGFVRGVKIMKSLLWKYTPLELRVAITELYKAMDEDIVKIESSSMSENTKNINKMKICDDVSMQVLEFLTVIIQYSPMSTEYKDMEVFGDFQELIKTIRNREPVKMFAGEIQAEE
jgi:hypothetical protein